MLKLTDCLVRSIYSCPNNPTFDDSNGIYEVVKTDENRNASNYSALLDELRRVNSARSMKLFLENYVRWNVRINAVQQISEFSENISLNYSNQLSFSRFCDSCYSPDAEKIFLGTFDDYYVVIFILGLVSLFGNGTTIFHVLKIIIKQNFTNEKERKIYNILVLNLCLADLLMGIHLTIGTIALRFDFLDSTLCNALGIMSALSIQVSASILVIITCYRLYGVLFPFNHIRIKLSVISLVIIWFLWLVVVSIPLFNEKLFAFEFTQEVVITNSDNEEKIELYGIIRTIQNLAKNLNTTDELFNEVLHVLNKYKSNEVALQLLKSFNLINFEHSEIDFIDYYDVSTGCTFDALVEAKIAAAYFSGFVYLFNLIEYGVIFIAYFVMFSNLSDFSITKTTLCLRQKTNFNKHSQKTRNIKAANKQIYKQIFAVVITNAVCCLPICIITVIYNFGSVLFDCLPNRSFKHWSVPIVTILLPLNSIINPYIYSFPFWQKVFKQGKRRCLKSAT